MLAGAGEVHIEQNRDLRPYVAFILEGAKEKIRVHQGSLVLCCPAWWLLATCGQSKLRCAVGKREGTTVAQMSLSR